MKKITSILIAATLATVTAPLAHADWQGYPSSFIDLTNLPASLAQNQVSSYANNYLSLSGTGAGVETIFAGSNLMTGNVTLWVYSSVDGTNASSAPFAIWPIPANGTNLVIANTNWSNLQLKGYAGLFFTVSNGSGNAIALNTTLTNLVTGNTSVAGGVIINRPNRN